MESWFDQNGTYRKMLKASGQKLDPKNDLVQGWFLLQARKNEAARHKEKSLLEYIADRKLRLKHLCDMNAPKDVLDKEIQTTEDEVIRQMNLLGGASSD